MAGCSSKHLNVHPKFAGEGRGKGYFSEKAGATVTTVVNGWIVNETIFALAQHPNPSLIVHITGRQLLYTVR